VIVCPRCGKENQDHYKFCLGCGAELPRDAVQQPKSFTAPTPPAGFASQGGGAGSAPAAVAPSAPAPAPAVAAPAAPAAPAAAAAFGGAAAAAAPAPVAAGGDLACPQCQNAVPQDFKFCGKCGHPMDEVRAGAAPAAAAAAAPAPAPAPAAEGRGVLVLIRPDGTEGESFHLMESRTQIGRQTGALFGNDSYLSPNHATFEFGSEGLTVKDDESLNGIYYRVSADDPHELHDGSIFRVGQEIVRFEKIDTPPPEDGVEKMGSPNPGYLGRIRLVIGRETYGNSYCVPAEGMHMGRERGDIIFPDDGYVSGLHCRIHGEGGKILLTDVGSSNGTFMRVAGASAIKSGTMLLMGQQLFRVEY